MLQYGFYSVITQRGQLMFIHHILKHSYGSNTNVWPRLVVQLWLQYLIYLTDLHILNVCICAVNFCS